MAIVVWLALFFALVCLIIKRKENFKFQGGWLAGEGDFDWVEVPAYVKDDVPKAPASMAQFAYDKDKTLVALENAGRRLFTDETRPKVRTAAAQNLTQSRQEMWALIPDAENKRFRIRSATPSSEFIRVSPDCETLSMMASGDVATNWVIQDVGNGFHIRIKCKDGNMSYLVVDAQNNLDVSQAPPAQPWTIKRVAQPAK